MKQRIIAQIWKLRELQANVTPSQRAVIQREIIRLQAILDKIS